MAPDDATPSDSSSDAGSGASAPDVSHVLAAVESLTLRVTALEQAIADISAAQPVRVADGMPSANNLPSIIAAPPPPPRISTEMPETMPIPRSRSLEDRLGSQIFNRIAIVAILIGAALGLKLAVDNHLIGPLGRVLIGLLSGAGLVLWSERFRLRQFAAFSYSLKAVGTGVLYLSLWASFQLFHLLPAGGAFALMLLVTLWNAWMAWSQQSQVLAAYALAGAFATPALLSTGGNHQVFLFSYLFTIDLASIALVRLADRPSASQSTSWSKLLLAALPATILYFIGWYSHYYTAAQLLSTTLFIALFFIAFLSIPFRVNSRTEQTQADPLSDVLLPLLNAVFASLALYSVLEDSGNHASLPWVALIFSVIYLVAVRVPQLARSQTATARAVHLSLAVLFLTLAIPLKASGRWITIGWLTEGVALLWVSARLEGTSSSNSDAEATSQRMLRGLALLALSLAFLGLLITPYWIDRSTHTAIINIRFATELAGIFGLALATWISGKAAVSRSRTLGSFPAWRQLAASFSVALNLVALHAGIAEIHTFWTGGITAVHNTEVELQTALSISAFLMIYGAGLLAIGFRRHSAFLRWQGLGLLVIAILKTFLYDVRNLSQGYRVASFLGLGAFLMMVSFAYVRREGQIGAPKESDKGP